MIDRPYPVLRPINPMPALAMLTADEARAVEWREITYEEALLAMEKRLLGPPRQPSSGSLVVRAWLALVVAWLVGWRR